MNDNEKLADFLNRQPLYIREYVDDRWPYWRECQNMTCYSMKVYGNCDTSFVIKRYVSERLRRENKS